MCLQRQTYLLVHCLIRLNINMHGSRQKKPVLLFYLLVNVQTHAVEHYPLYQIKKKRRRARCIRNNNGVLIFLAIASLTVTLSRLCLILIFFRQISFFPIHSKKNYQYCNHAEMFCTKCTLTLRMYALCTDE